MHNLTDKTNSSLYMLNKIGMQINEERENKANDEIDHHVNHSLHKVKGKATKTMNIV